MAKKRQSKEVTAAGKAAPEQAQTPAQPKTNHRVTPEIVTDLKHELTTSQLALQQYGGNPAVLSLPDNMPERDFLAFGVKIGRVMEFASWRIGDYVNFGQKQYGYKDYEKVTHATGLSQQYLRACASVSGRVPPERRLQHSLEKWRLMLPLQNVEKKETLDELEKRVGNKSQKDLREMSSAPRVTDTKVYKASDLQHALKSIVDSVPFWDDARVEIFVGLNQKTPRADHTKEKPHYYGAPAGADRGNLLDVARDTLATLTAMVEVYEADKAAKHDAAVAAANAAHDKGELDPKSPQKGEKPF